MLHNKYVKCDLRSQPSAFLAQSVERQSHSLNTMVSRINLRNLKVDSSNLPEGKIFCHPYRPLAHRVLTSVQHVVFLFAARLGPLRRVRPNERLGSCAVRARATAQLQHPATAWPPRSPALQGMGPFAASSDTCCPPHSPLQLSAPCSLTARQVASLASDLTPRT